MEQTLNNKYYLMRHGRSLANQAGLIVSNLSNGSDSWGLAPDSRPAILVSLEKTNLPGNTIIYSSPFLRTRETAEIAAEALRCPGPVVSEPLRERFFGSYDGGPDVGYSSVWRHDRLAAGNRTDGVESPGSVLKRLLNFLEKIDSENRGSTILLVSHGDPMNILLTHAAGLPANRHRDIESMETSEIRLLHP